MNGNQLERVVEILAEYGRQVEYKAGIEATLASDSIPAQNTESISIDRPGDSTPPRRGEQTNDV